ncbi:PEP/pyruvate-binding domain-containing protein [Piscinibacter terrae]|uniref:Pyruvate, phosphate dikinase n=1 Tax=Piscinibacter terrae TaxID=2496871 RepID=A0A3N7HM88_9BURK|nr:PEP/pyruvate-binding domain-containing protein [Albitalea terrae]RQP21741.1 pyruvate, phosphate dikinase [Albitalea terrae]
MPTAMSGKSGKYATLQALSGQLPIPAFFGLQEAQRARLWLNAEAIQAEAQAILHNIHFTAAAFLDRDLAQLDACAPLAWHPEADQVLLEWLAAAGLAPDAQLAVRSSASIEDGTVNSFAGVFDTVLHVSGLPALRAAIERVWRSSFSRRAAMERLRCGLLESPLSMTVIVQQMVAARWAGVAFSHDPVSAQAGMLIEAVPGLGEALVSGEVRASTAVLGDGVPRGSPALLAERAMLDSIRCLVQQAEAALGQPVDIEWAFDAETVWLLQARPITTLKRRDDHPACCDAVALYLAGDDELAPFKPLPDFAQYFRSKRRPLALLAQQHGVPAGSALLVRANADGFADPKAAASLLSQLHGGRVVLDFSAGVRQQILDAGDLPARLSELLTPELNIFTLRDYIKGEFGIITQPLATPPGQPRQVLCEYSADGLLALNRGSASTTSFHIDEDGQCDATGPAASLFSAAQRLQLFEVSSAAVDRFGQVQLEWVLDAGRLRLIDFSEVATLHLKPSGDGQRTVSPGYARGRTLLVLGDRELEDISIAATVSINHLPSAESLGPRMMQLLAQARAEGERPIIVSPRPYAALAALIPYAAGFVFEQSSLLCHLAILLREGQLPAIESAALFSQARQGEPVVIGATSEEHKEAMA